MGTGITKSKALDPWEAGKAIYLVDKAQGDGKAFLGGSNMSVCRLLISVCKN